MLVAALGLALALGQCFAVGPVNAEALRRGLRSGFGAALAVEIGSCFGDGLWAALAFTGLSALLALPFMDLAASVAGFVLLGYLAVQSWRGAKPVVFDPSLLDARPSDLPGVWAGLLLSVVNPGSAAFWVGVGATVLASHLPVVGPSTLIQFAAGYYAALVGWSFAFSALAWQLGRRLPTPAQVGIQRAVSIFLGALAAFSLVAAARRLSLAGGPVG